MLYVTLDAILLGPAHLTSTYPAGENAESFRKNMLCTWTNEHAMREIYLKPFEISVKDGGADNVITA